MVAHCLGSSVMGFFVCLFWTKWTWRVHLFCEWLSQLKCNKSSDKSEIKRFKQKLGVRFWENMETSTRYFMWRRRTHAATIMKKFQHLDSFCHFSALLNYSNLIERFRMGSFSLRQELKHIKWLLSSRLLQLCQGRIVIWVLRYVLLTVCIADGQYTRRN